MVLPITRMVIRRTVVRITSASSIAAVCMLDAQLWPIPLNHTDDDPTVYICHELWPKPTARQFFTVTSLVLQYVIPVGVITYCYSCVSLALTRRARAKATITGRTAASRCHGDREQVNHRWYSILLCACLPVNSGCPLTRPGNVGVSRWRLQFALDSSRLVQSIRRFTITLQTVFYPRSRILEGICPASAYRCCVLPVIWIPFIVFLHSLFLFTILFQCFDIVRWMIGRTTGL